MSLINRALPRTMSAALNSLSAYTACDISDALVKLNVPGAGYLADLRAFSPSHSPSSSTIAPVSTILFASKADKPSAESCNIPNDTHWADLTEPDTFVVMQQPPGQTNAICGGIMAQRMQVRGVKGVIVAGRVRDVQELQSTKMPILALGQSTVGMGAASLPWAVQVSLTINGVVVRPGDIAYHDAANGVVVVPRDKVDEVLDLLPKLTAADDKVKEDILGGSSVYDALKRHR